MRHCVSKASEPCVVKKVLAFGRVLTNHFDARLADIQSEDPLSSPIIFISGGVENRVAVLVRWSDGTQGITLIDNLDISLRLLAQYKILTAHLSHFLEDAKFACTPQDLYNHLRKSPVKQKAHEFIHKKLADFLHDEKKAIIACLKRKN